MMNGSDTPLAPFPIRKRLQHFWIRHRWVDLALGILVVLVWFGAAAQCWFPEDQCMLPEALTAVPPESRRVVFQLIAAAAATMGGFTLTSISILVNLLRTPLSTIDRLLPAADKSRVGEVFLGVLPWLLGLFIAALICLAADVNMPQGYVWMQLTTVGLLVAAVMSLGRVVWVLRRLLSVSAP
jgi:hypothetical protein